MPTIGAKPLRVLFLCTGNSARSILAEALINFHGRGTIVGYSAGSHPKGQVHPETLEVLQRYGLPVAGFRSKGWDEFAKPSPTPLDYVITVCDSAAGEVCPVWPGHPATEHWGIPDPAAVAGNDAAVRDAFESTFLDVEGRILAFLERVVIESEVG